MKAEELVGGERKMRKDRRIESGDYVLNDGQVDDDCVETLMVRISICDDAAVQPTSGFVATTEKATKLLDIRRRS